MNMMTPRVDISFLFILHSSKESWSICEKNRYIVTLGLNRKEASDLFHDLQHLRSAHVSEMYNDFILQDDVRLPLIPQSCCRKLIM